MGIQTITTPAGEEMVVMPRAEYEALVAQRDEAFEDGADAAVFQAALADMRPEDVLPAEISAAILAGRGRVRAFREWRGLSLTELSRSIDLPETDLESIEVGASLLSRETAARIAEVLKLPSGWLTV